MVFDPWIRIPKTQLIASNSMVLRDDFPFSDEMTTKVDKNVEGLQVQAVSYLVMDFKNTGAGNGVKYRYFDFVSRQMLAILTHEGLSSDELFHPFCFLLKSHCHQSVSTAVAAVILGRRRQFKAFTIPIATLLEPRFGQSRMFRLIRFRAACWSGGGFGFGLYHQLRA